MKRFLNLTITGLFLFSFLIITGMPKIAGAVDCYIKYATKEETLSQWADSNLFKVVPAGTPGLGDKALVILPYKYQDENDEWQFHKSCKDIDDADDVNYGCIGIDGTAYPYLTGKKFKEFIDRDCSNTSSTINVIFSAETHMMLAEPLVLDYTALESFNFNWCDDNDTTCTSQNVTIFKSKLFALNSSICSGECGIQIGSNIHIAKTSFAGFVTPIDYNPANLDEYYMRPHCEPWTYQFQKPIIAVAITGSNNTLKDVEIRYSYDTDSIKITGSNNTITGLGLDASCGVLIGGGSGNTVKEVSYIALPSEKEKKIEIINDANGFSSGGKTPMLRLRSVRKIEKGANGTMLKATLAGPDEFNFNQYSDSPCSITLVVAENELSECQAQGDNAQCYLAEVSLPNKGAFDYAEIYDASGDKFLGCIKYNEGAKTARGILKEPYDPAKKFVAVAFKSTGVSEYSEPAQMYRLVDLDGDGVSEECEKQLSEQYLDSFNLIYALAVHYNFSIESASPYLGKASLNNPADSYEHSYAKEKCDELKTMAYASASSSSYCTSQSLDWAEDLPYFEILNQCTMSKALAGVDSCRVNTVNLDGCFYDLDQDGIDDIGEDKCLGNKGDSIDSDNDGICDSWEDADGDGKPDGFVDVETPGNGFDDVNPPDSSDGSGDTDGGDLTPSDGGMSGNLVPDDDEINCPEGQVPDDEGICVDDEDDEDPDVVEATCDAGYEMNIYGECIESDAATVPDDSDGSSGGCSLKKSSGSGAAGCSLIKGANFDSFMPYMILLAILVITRKRKQA